MLEKPSSLSSEQVEIVNQGGNLKGETQAKSDLRMFYGA
jgi:hypothetical protein